MPFYDFIQREDVYGILQETLAEYFECEVKVLDGAVLSRSTEEALYLCFPRINAIIPVMQCYRAQEFIKRDLNITNSFMKRFVMNAYLRGVFCHPGKFAAKTLIVANKPQHYTEQLIYPGNKKIKIIDFQKKIIHNIVKKGFKRTWFEKEIQIRSCPKWDFVLPLNQINETLYSEPLIIGYPFTRLTDNIKAEHVSEINRCIATIQKNGNKEQISRYAKDLMENIEKDLGATRWKISQVLATKLAFFVHTIYRAVCRSNSTINLVFSHGDLQPGNIFLETNKNKLWILDWETWGIRSKHYDLLTLKCNMRNSSRLVKNIRMLFRENGKLFFSRAMERSALRERVLIFIMEDIAWQLKETEVLPAKCVSNGLKSYLSPKVQRQLLNLLELVS